MVQSLVLLPMVVAAITVLVKDSLPLAFSLAGIVAAVRFRSSLDDAKDAVFILLGTAIGIASGVQLSVAAVLSVLFVGVTLSFWYADYARVPPALEGERARRQMERAMAIANRTSQFVARLDREVLETMAPAQLDALANRVRRRRAEAGDDGELRAEPPRYDHRISLVVTDREAIGPLVEGVLEEHTKRWKREAESSTDGVTWRVIYAVRLRKGITTDELNHAVAQAGAPFIESSEVL
jgi:hypothetical protein